MAAWVGGKNGEISDHVGCGAAREYCNSSTHDTTFTNMSDRYGSFVCAHLRPRDLSGSSQPKHNAPPITSRSFRCVRSTKFANLRTRASLRPSVCCRYDICGLCDILDIAHRFPHAFLGESSCVSLGTGHFVSRT
jgi:hypothetical protein